MTRVKQTRVSVIPPPAVPEPRPTSDDKLIALWLHGKSKRTQVEYRRDIAGFVTFLRQSGKDGTNPVTSVTLGELQDYATELDQLGLEPASRARRLAAVKSLLSFGCRLGLLPVNVGAAVELPRRRDDLAERILTEAEVRRLVGAAEGRDRLLISLLYVGCLRISEALGLRWRDVRPRADGCQITVLGKGSKVRTTLIPLDLTAHRPDGASRDDFVFAGRHGALSISGAWRIVRRVAERAELMQDVSPHFLRHSHISHALDHAAPVHEVRQTAGHASLDTTTRYAHAKPNSSSAQYLPPL